MFGLNLSICKFLSQRVFFICHEIVCLRLANSMYVRKDEVDAATGIVNSRIALKKRKAEASRIRSLVFSHVELVLNSCFDKNIFSFVDIKNL